MTLEKIISGGQTGADRGGLDAAIELNIPHGGWCPKARRSEDGMIPAHYHLKETSTSSYPVRTEKNVVESDATVIFAKENLGKGSVLTVNLCVKHKKPVMIYSMAISAQEAASALREFISKWNVKVLNVAGSRESTSPGIHDYALEVIKLTLSS